MNIDNEMKKLSIESDKIIPILLKHLMVLKNENAFLKNSAAIYSIENGMPNTIYKVNRVPDGIIEKRDGIENVGNDIMEKRDGIENVGNGIMEKRDGIENVGNDIMEKRDGIENVGNGIMEKRDGIENVGNDIMEKGDGIENVGNDIMEKRDGIKNVGNGIMEKRDGIENVLEALQGLSNEANSGVLIYSVFEKALIMALEQYIKSGDGQKTLYSFYTDFVEAMEKQNLAEEKSREAVKNFRLEDTHFLPAIIEENKESIHKLKVVLHGYFSVSATRGMYKRVASELLFLHNEGKATGAQLRELTKLSEPGFRKHIPKLVRTGLIKKQAPLNYVLTENSIHILLELFGKPKNYEL